MSDVAVIDTLRHMFVTGVKVAGPILLVALAIGVAVSLLQTITQVQEPSIVFLLKLGAVALVVMLAGPWMLQEIRSFVVQLWSQIGPTT
jgi:flagellar biosynthesis protein FliQ